MIEFIGMNDPGACGQLTEETRSTCPGGSHDDCDSSARLELALNASRAGVCSWEIESEVIVCDNRLRVLFGFENDVAITRAQVMARMHPEDREILQAELAGIDLPGAGNQWNQEFRITHPDLGERWLGRLGRVERDAGGRARRLVGISFDITERKQAEATMRQWNQNLERRVAERTVELVQSEARFRQLAEATFEGIAISDDGILVDGNPQLARIYGCDLSEMIGRPVTDFVSPESRDIVARSIREGSESIYECVGLRPDGSKFPQEVHSSTIHLQGRAIRVTALRDRTDFKLAAARVQALQTELEHSQRLGLVSEVSAGIIHQIGQPLCAIGANVSAALTVLRAKGDSGVGVLEILEDIEADFTRIRESVVHLRALANPSQASRIPIDLNVMVSDVMGLLSQEAARRRIEIEADCCDSLPMIEGDSVQLSQVILNLMHNAFDACERCPQGRRVVTVATRRSEGGGVEMSVSDTGTGIAPAVMPGLFAPFFTTKREGLGMGLRLSLTIVRAHGGSIEGRNHPDRPGAVFRVTLPASPGPKNTKG